MWIFSNGRSAYGPHGEPGVSYPSDRNLSAVYSDGIVWGGLVRDGRAPEVRAGGQLFYSGMQAGSILARGVAENAEATNVNRVWRIRRDYRALRGNIDELRREAAQLFGASVFDVTLEQALATYDRYERDWREWPWQKGAPFYDTGVDGLFDYDEPGFDPRFNPDPQHDNYPRGAEGDRIKQEEEEPGLAGADQVIWLVCNDLDSALTKQYFSSPPSGLEMQTTLWSYAGYEYGLQNLLFKNYRVIYKGAAHTPRQARIDSMFFGQWSDPDVGNAGDDFIGCDTTLALAYAYNGKSSDAAALHLPPPAIGYALLAGPVIDAPGQEGFFGLKPRKHARNQRMNAFNSFFAHYGSAASYESTTLSVWNLLRGYQSAPPHSPQPWRDPSGRIATFLYPGDPQLGLGWNDEQSPGDRQLLLASGPFSLALGDTNEITVALVGGLHSDLLASVAALKSNTVSARGAARSLFVFPQAPVAPQFSATTFENKILLKWGENVEAVARTEQATRGEFQFEGYNVYQLPSANAALSAGRKLATFDRVNGVRRIIQDEFDPLTGLVAPRVLQEGTDSGVQYDMLLARDALHNGILVNGREYFFAVTAYNYNQARPFDVASIESAPQILTVVPHDVALGVRWQARYEDTLAVHHSKGSSNGRVQVRVIDPGQMTGDQYHVKFSVEPQRRLWHLRNETKARDLLMNMTNRSGDGEYFTTEGVQVIVSDRVGFAGWEVAAGELLWSWANAQDFQLESFNGVIGWGGSYPYNPTTVAPDRLFDVLIKFSATTAEGDPVNAGDVEVSYAYRYLRNAHLPPAQSAFAHFIVNPSADFAFQDFKKSVPWAAYEYDRATRRIGKRLSLGFLENNVAAGRVDGKWWPPAANETSNTIAEGPCEWFFIFDHEYRETPDTILASATATMFNGVAKPILLWGTAMRKSAAPVSAGNALALFASRLSGPEDEFTFQTLAPRFERSRAQQDALREINVYPNPYDGAPVTHPFDNEETFLPRQVTFTHLPEQARIRIFNIGGQLVKTIHKDDVSAYARWNLLNEAGRLVASGMYIVHVELPGLGIAKTLKLAILQQ